MGQHAASNERRIFFRILIGLAAAVVFLLGAGYITANIIIHKKINEALRNLPPGLSVSYAALHANVLTGSVVLNGVTVEAAPEQRMSIGRVAVSGIHLLDFVTKHRLYVRRIDIDSVNAELRQEKSWSLPEMHPPFTEALIEQLEVKNFKVKMGGRYTGEMEGALTLDSVWMKHPGEKPGVGAVRLVVERAKGMIPDMDEVVRLRGVEVDSRREVLRVDTLNCVPGADKEAIGRAKGHQVDVVEATSEGIEVRGLDVMALLDKRLTADEISVRSNHIYVFRDRRLPLAPGEKAMPMDGLRDAPVKLRVKKVKLGPTFFEYEEFPKTGDKTGAMKIYRLTGTLEPLINRPVAGDPAYLIMTTTGSLMNSGTVTATTKLPLQKGDPYEVEGAFHELDVTKLNNPAENLGKLHLESGMLNHLDFWFEMTDERSTGKIIGEYHDLVVDKLKDKSADPKVDKLKSFALKHFIIPKDKDKSLPVKKRTGKVDYKRDKERYFSYYLLHSLLVGVKSSFSLGFLLPG